MVSRPYSALTERLMAWTSSIGTSTRVAWAETAELSTLARLAAAGEAGTWLMNFGPLVRMLLLSWCLWWCLCIDSMLSWIMFWIWLSDMFSASVLARACWTAAETVEISASTSAAEAPLLERVKTKAAAPRFLTMDVLVFILETF